MTETPEYVICLKCFTHNPPGEDFCKNCGAYLPYEGMPGEPATPPTADDAPVPHPAFGLEPEAEHDTGEGRADAASAADSRAAGDAKAPQKRSARPAGDIDDTGTALRKPTAPAAPRPRPSAAPVPAEPAAAPDDVVCPVCHTRNRPERRFCRRCGNRLASTAPMDASAQPAAGSRPRGWSTRFPFAAVIVLLVLVGLLVAAWLNRDVVIGFVSTIVEFVFSSQST
ncbi:MAG TPA: hypothetical protein VFY91_16670 [Microbacterium sp.]|nr:hypothetical protein [Microbacterium sp.]